MCKTNVVPDSSCQLEHTPKRESLAEVNDPCVVSDPPKRAKLGMIEYTAKNKDGSLWMNCAMSGRGASGGHHVHGEHLGLGYMGLPSPRKDVVE